MVTGAIADDDLAKTNPGLIAKIEAIMADHPDKARFDRALAGFSGKARTRRLFELMARWPDDAGISVTGVECAPVLRHS